MSAPTPSENGWYQAYDPSSGVPYYINSVSRATAWSLPEDGTVIGIVGQPPATASNEDAAAAAAADKEGAETASGSGSGSGGGEGASSGSGSGSGSGAAGAGAGSSEAEISNTSSAVKEGWLEKSDPKGKNWKKRWVVVNQVDGTLTYYGDDPRRTLSLYRVTETPKGTISLRGAASIDRVPGDKKFPSAHCLRLVTKDRTTYFCAPDVTTMKEWLAFTRIAIGGTFSGLSSAPASSTLALRARVGIEPRKHEGILMKTAPDGRTWTERWAVVDPETKTLMYYESREKEKIKGLVDLRHGAVKVGIDETTLRDVPSFQVISTGRTFGFCCSSVDELQEWLDMTYAAISAPTTSRASDSGTYEGFLQKSDPKGRNWKKRWFAFTLADKSLKYYQDESKAVEKGTISLSGARVHIATKEVSAPNVFTLVVVTSDRTFYMCADDLTSLITWLDNILTVPDVVVDAGTRHK